MLPYRASRSGTGKLSAITDIFFSNYLESVVRRT